MLKREYEDFMDDCKYFSEKNYSWPIWDLKEHLKGITFKHMQLLNSPCNNYINRKWRYCLNLLMRSTIPKDSLCHLWSNDRKCFSKSQNLYFHNFSLLCFSLMLHGFPSSCLSFTMLHIFLKNLCGRIEYF